MVSRLALLLPLVLAAACTRTMLKASLVNEHGTRDEFVEMDFWDGLAEQRMVTNHDALHALILSFTKSNPTTYEQRLELAHRRGWIKAEAIPPANESARIGWIAKAVCIEADIKGGLTMRMLGARERYAVNELNFRGWLPNMSRNQAVSGLQLVALLSSAEDYVERNPTQPKEDW
jgi:hypothetical protein